MLARLLVIGRGLKPTHCEPQVELVMMTKTTGSQTRKPVSKKLRCFIKTKSCQNISELSAAKLKNKTLVSALDETRQGLRKLREENIELQKERQELFEKVGHLERQLSETHTINQSLVDLFTKLHQDFAQGISAIRNTNKGLGAWNVSSITPDVQRLSPQPNQNLQEELSQLRARSPMVVQLSSTPIDHNSIVIDVDHSHASTGEDDMDICLGDESWSTPVPNAVTTTGSSNVTPMTTIGELSHRPKRSCAMSVSYDQPSLIKKLRRGDRFTDSTTNCWTPYRGKRTKKRKLDNTLSVKSKGLSDITNMRK